MRAVLFANATATTRLGRRRRSPITHGSALVAFERSRLALAPLIRSRRKYWLPRLDMPPNRFLPPVEFWRLADRFGIRSVVLVPLDVGLHVLRRHQPHLVAQRTQLPRPVMRRRTRLHSHQTAR